eukprot:7055858-Prymnesium_polylepis.1
MVSASIRTQTQSNCPCTGFSNVLRLYSIRTSPFVCAAFVGCTVCEGDWRRANPHDRRSPRMTISCVLVLSLPEWLTPPLANEFGRPYLGVHLRTEGMAFTVIAARVALR